MMRNADILESIAPLEENNSCPPNTAPIMRRKRVKTRISSTKTVLSSPPPGAAVGSAPPPPAPVGVKLPPSAWFTTTKVRPQSLPGPVSESFCVLEWLRDLAHVRMQLEVFIANCREFGDCELRVRDYLLVSAETSEAKRIAAIIADAEAKLVAMIGKCVAAEAAYDCDEVQT